MYRYYKRVSGIGSCNYIFFLRSKELHNENITT